MFQCFLVMTMKDLCKVFKIAVTSAPVSVSLIFTIAPRSSFASVVTA